MICVELHCTGRHNSSHGPAGVELCPRARRRKSAHDRKAKRIKRGAPDVYDEPDNEVKVVAGRCVTWNCYNPAPDGPECAEHATEPLPAVRRRPDRAEAERRRRQEDPEYAERVRVRKRAAARIARNNPEYRERKNLARREAVRAKLGLTDIELDVPLQTARRERRRDTILLRLREHGSVAVGELAKEFEVTPSCITEDIRHLVDQGLAERVYGGARLTETTSNRGVAA